MGEDKVGPSRPIGQLLLADADQRQHAPDQWDDRAIRNLSWASCIL